MLDVSGGARAGLLRSELEGPALLTGGGSGVEASALTLIFGLAAAALLLWLARRKGHMKLFTLQAPVGCENSAAA